ncbi:MAG TPA: HAMP domain-containing sensor histidine kinase [Cyclobacteriaceae bacterium]|nr:HAMP domain-containing sensor histidine kinase [Cyclobacteriaceae bacterium]
MRSESIEHRGKIFNNLPYPTLVAEVIDGVCYNTVVNEKFLDEIGYSVSEIPTLDDWFEKAYPDATYRSHVVNSWTSLARQSKEEGLDDVIMIAHITTKKFGRRWYEVKASIAHEVHTVGFVDIDEFVGNEKTLRARIENKNKTLTILSHDLRGPLSNLLGLSRLALERGIAQEELNTLLDKISRRTEQALQLLETTLIWTRSNFGQIKVRHERVMIKDVVASACDVVGNVADDKKISIVQHDLESAQLTTDREIFTIIVRNILSNAVKFSPDAGTVIISFKGDNNVGCLEISDEGPGMSTSVVESILEGRRLDQNAIAPGQGAGIGLRFCVDLAHQISAKISFHTRAPKGTLVRIEFTV